MREASAAEAFQPSALTGFCARVILCTFSGAILHTYSSFNLHKPTPPQAHQPVELAWKDLYKCTSLLTNNTQVTTLNFKAVLHCFNMFALCA